MSEDLRMEGKCAYTDPEAFFPLAAEGTPVGDAERAYAKSVCAGCPVRSACLEWALDTGQDYGVWGGMTEGERRTLPGRPQLGPEPVAHAIEVSVNGQDNKATTLHALVCQHTKRFTEERKQPVSASELSILWKAAMAGEGNSKFCRACKPWQQVPGLHEAEELYRPLVVKKQTCARCGHRSGECPRCEERHVTLGGRIHGVPYCHTFVDEPSCYMIQLSADAMNAKPSRRKVLA